jgi:hypothetical protein
MALSHSHATVRLVCGSALLSALCGAFACSSDAGFANPTPSPSRASGGLPLGAATGGSSGASGMLAPTGSTTSTVPPMGRSQAKLTELGVWQVSGKDARGDFEGQVELRQESDTLRFIRIVRYPADKNPTAFVEGDRILHLAWTGSASGLNDNAVVLSGLLDPRDFVVRRGAVERKLSDMPTAVRAQVARESGVVRASWTQGNESFEETWRDRAPSATKPIFDTDLTIKPAHTPPTATERTTMFGTFASYQALPIVAPYKDRAEFKTAIFQRVFDRTDADFYRQNPKALRLINKPVDAISLQEAKVRADAFGPTLEAKARGFDLEMEHEFMDPGVWFAPDSRLDDGTIVESGDGSLWTATYIASQIYRFEVTGETQAKVNAKRSLDALMKLQEITGEPAEFARTLRKSTGPVDAPASLPWHRGTGVFAGLDWLQGGNNDMFKGLLLGYTLGYPFFCEGADKASHAELCTRLRSNVEALSATRIGGDAGNVMASEWLSAVVSGSVQKRLRAEQRWQTSRLELQAYAVEAKLGIADWSGIHLTFIGTVVDRLLAERLDLGGNAVDTVSDFIDRSHENLKDQRILVWAMLRQRFGKTKPGVEYLEDGKWRLREVPFPKPQIVIDHRVSPSFCMGPYPSLPWKNDWTTNDRSQGLYSYPMFAEETGVMVWKNGMGYKFDATGRKSAGYDYLHLYWFARKHGILQAGQ